MKYALLILLIFIVGCNKPETKYVNIERSSYDEEIWFSCDLYIWEAHEKECIDPLTPEETIHRLAERILELELEMRYLKNMEK